MKYKQNWEETKEKFRNYWKHQNTGRPLIIVVAEKEGAAAASGGIAVQGYGG